MSDNILIVGKGTFSPVSKDRSIEHDSFLHTPDNEIYFVDRQGLVTQVDSLPDGKSMLCLEPA